MGYAVTLIASSSPADLDLETPPLSSDLLSLTVAQAKKTSSAFFDVAGEAT
jgi:hypothetical protein